MTRKDEDLEADEREDEDEGEDRDSDTEAEPEPAPKPSTKSSAGRKAAPVAAKKSAGVSTANVGLLLAVALAAGGAAGWFGHIQQAKAAIKAEVVAPASSTGVVAGPCGTWADKICQSGGKTSSACQQARGATELLTPSACEAGIAALPATLTKLKASRATCEKLVTKLCADLPPGSQTCGMVKERTPSFPAQRCDEMLKHYDEVISGLKQMDQQQGGMMPPMGAAAPGMASPH